MIIHIIYNSTDIFVHRIRIPLSRCDRHLNQT